MIQLALNMLIQLNASRLAENTGECARDLKLLRAAEFVFLVDCNRIVVILIDLPARGIVRRRLSP